MTDGTAKWVSGDSGARLVLVVTLSRTDDFTFAAKVFQAKIKNATTGATIAKTTLDLANLANVHETAGQSSPAGVTRSYGTVLEFARSDGVGILEAQFVVTAQEDVTPPLGAPTDAKRDENDEDDAHRSPRDSMTSASSLGPDEDVVEVSDGEVNDGHVLEASGDTVDESGDAAYATGSVDRVSSSPSHVEQDLEGFGDGGGLGTHTETNENSFVDDFGDETVEGDVSADDVPRSPALESQIPIHQASLAEPASPVPVGTESSKAPSTPLMSPEQVRGFPNHHIPPLRLPVPRLTLSC